MKVCPYCKKEADGPMLKLGDVMVHSGCMVEELNKLIDPDYFGEGQPKLIIGNIAQALAEDRKKIGKWLKLRFNFKGEWQGSLADYEDVIKNLEQGKLPEGIDD